MTVATKYDGCLTSNGFYMSVDKLMNVMGKDYNALLDKLTIHHVPHIGAKVTRRTYLRFTQNNTAYIFLPRTMLAALSKIPSINIKMGLVIPKQLDVQLHCELHEHQRIIVGHLMNNVFTTAKIQNGTAACLLDLKPGKGKTFIAAAIIALLRYPTLYITVRDKLAEQAVKDLTYCLHDHKLVGPQQVAQGGAPFVVKRYNKSDATLTYGVCVMVINTAIKLDHTALKGFGLVVFDEAHCFCTEHFSTIFRKAVSPALLAVSGTTSQRKDPFDAIVHKETACGGIIYAHKLVPDDPELPFDITVRIIKYSGPPEYSQVLCGKQGRMSTHLMLGQFMKDPYRTRVLMDELKELYNWSGPSNKSQHCTYVFCEEKGPLLEFAKNISAHLSGGGVSIPELDVGVFMGGVTQQQYENVRDYARVILATYSFAGTGISMLKATSIVLLSSRRSQFRQIIARILRMCSDYEIPRIIVDLVNVNTPMRNQLASRMVEYQYYNAKIEHKKVSWESVEPQLIETQ